MGSLKPLFGMFAVTGVVGVVIAIAVPLSIVATRDGRWVPPPEPRPTSTPVLQGVQAGPSQGTPTPIPTAATPTPTFVAEPTPTSVPSPTATPVVSGPTATPSSTSGDPQAGSQVFSSAAPLACSSCHTLDGSSGIGPSLQGLASRAGERVAGLSAEEYIRESIVDPAAFIVPGFSPVMPPGFGDSLSTEQLNDLIAFLLTLE